MIFLQKGVKLVLQTHEMKTDDGTTFCKKLLNVFFIHIFLINIKLIMEICRQETNNHNHKDSLDIFFALAAVLMTGRLVRIWSSHQSWYLQSSLQATAVRCPLLREPYWCQIPTNASYKKHYCISHVVTAYKPLSRLKSPKSCLLMWEPCELLNDVSGVETFNCFLSVFKRREAEVSKFQR